ncbi:MAG: aminoacyl-tRNA hydrolase, partial [Dehalococcoidia bacterium]|nr:aminoacyl-tRNA hydrolase [Dehalococcoidia bacterium]
IIRALDSRDFARIRVGIGRPDAGAPLSTTLEVVEYVLGRFSSEEKNIAKQAVAQASAALYDILYEGLDKAMNRFNPPRHSDEIPQDASLS